MTIQHEREKTTVAQPATTRPASPAPPPTTPHPLESGDRLSRAEFERRYEAMPQLKKAELVEGVVYVGSPVRHQIHSRPNAIIVAWLATLNPLAIVLVSYLFAGLLVGGDAIQPAGIDQLLQGVILFVVVAGDMLLHYRVRLVQG